MPRYVLLRHEMPSGSDRASHWDFMLEREGVLWTWAVEELPARWREQLRLPRENASEEVTALRIGNHRLAYLDYEGAVSGNRGSVRRIAKGAFEWSHNNGQQVEVTLSGELSSDVVLTLNRESDAEALAARKPAWRLHAVRIASK